jgi:hypothetical protein
MRKITHKAFIILYFITYCIGLGQNQNNKWYFGSMAGLDFNTSTPTPFNTSSMGAPFACSSICDQNGNTLFYSHSSTLWNQNNISVGNGSFSGNPGGSQTVLLLKKPGASVIYYAFILSSNSVNSSFLAYTIDLSLAGGTGSVVSNSIISLPANVNSSEKITGTKHCNGIDYWVVLHPKDQAKFYSILVSNSGISNSPVISQTGIDTINASGYMKISPTGRKIAVVGKRGNILLHDFDNLTGAVSTNSTVLTGTYNAYGLEFSPDGSKLYMSSGKIGNSLLWQWDLCAGNASAINNSKQVIYADNSGSNGALMLAPNGKIYKARNGVDTLGVINNPNLAGLNCNYQNSGQSLAGQGSGWGMPNQIANVYKPQSTINATLSCQNITLTTANYTHCPTIADTPNSNLWSFGDPSSGSANTSTLLSPTHFFTGIGNYTIMLIQSFNCHTDTIYKSIQITNISPTLSISGPTVICSGEKLNLTASGTSIQSFLWQSGTTNATLVASPTVSATYSVIGTNNMGCTATNSIVIQVNKCLELDQYSGQLDFKIYPNPSNGEFFIQNEKLAIKFISITNILGEEVECFMSSFKDSMIKVNFNGVRNGIYFVKIRTNGSTQTKQIIKIQ